MDRRIALRRAIALAKAEISARFRLLRGGLVALIAAEFASRFADAMNAEEYERDAMVARLEQEQAAKLEAAMAMVAAEAAEEKKTAIGSLLLGTPSSRRSHQTLAFANAKVLCTRMRERSIKTRSPWLHARVLKPG